MTSNIKWATMSTQFEYPFKVWRSNKDYGNVILLSEYPGLDCTKYKSLTNNIEEVIAAVLLVLIYLEDKLSDNIKWYQWVEGEGLFELKFIYSNYDVSNVKRNFISDSLDTFEVLYVS